MMGTRMLAAASLIVLALTGALAADRTIHVTKDIALVVPNGSPVRFASYDDHNITAKFVGRFALTGLYRITFAQGGGYTELNFEPDRTWVARLPYWKAYQQHARQIAFDNPDDFLKAVLPAHLRHKGQISGRVAVNVNGYQTGIECDWPWFTVHYLSIEHAPALLAKAGADDDIGC